MIGYLVMPDKYFIRFGAFSG